MSRSDSPVTGTHPRFSFVIISYNTLPLTRAAVASLGQCAFPHEVIVVDNHSTDGTAAALREEFADLKIIEFEENRGISVASNAGVKIASGDWIIWMNSDVEIFADTMTVVEDLLRRHPELDVLGGQLVNPDGSLQTSVLMNYHLVRDEQRELVEVSGLVGAFMLVRRETWEKLNGMDEGLFFYGEDGDFCSRAIAAGAVLRWSPRFRTLHHRSGSSRKVNLRSVVENLESTHYICRKNMFPEEYHAYIRRSRSRCFYRSIWYFSLSVPTLFLLPAFSGRFRKYFYLFRWYLLGCPPGWGLRPVKKT
ncbi:MAG TPA: glycosyltransferase family 2 protein [Verrucomicrobiae bacterium]|jgi:hypothetical protein